LQVINQYDIEEGSGVFTTLEGLPLYEASVPDAEEKKLGYLYTLWGRPTIPLNMSSSYCSDFIQVISELKELVDVPGTSNMETYNVLGIISAAFTFITFIFYSAHADCVQSGRDHRTLKFMRSFLVITVLIINSALLILTFTFFFRIS